MAISEGTRLGPYEILAPLGAGGMGEVYLARDTRLDRRVALKILPAQFADDQTRVDRFTREARSASALTHPNVATIYDVGESNGLRFIAMEYVQGVTLAERISREPLAPGEIVAMAIQIADALEAAHAGGVIHRDIKPANVMVTSRGQVKVLDFGLAHTESTTAADSAITLGPGTTPGLVLGTVSYMSPEQTIGQRVDCRSDLFSLGAVLYQSVTGQLPFAGSTTVHTIELIRHGQPQAIARLNYSVPLELERVIRKCLEKDPGRRYQSAKELLIDLRNLERDSDAGFQAEGARSRRHNLPEQLTTFVGRQQELEQLARLATTSRLLTLTGAGGCGKTRLALKVAADRVQDYPDGVWLVDLAPISDPELVPHVIAGALGVSEGPSRSLGDALIDHLRVRNLLLVVDNCEHLIGACAELSERLLRAAPHLRILATSREGLGVQGETVWRVPSLASPAPQHLSPAKLLEFDAVRLFLDRAASIAPFTLTEANSLAVAEICHRLDGIPLAIELAAARVSVLSVEQINARLKDRFRLLTGGGRTAVARQRTLEATVDWSYDLLNATEGQLLRRLSVFSGGWTIEAAEQVASKDGIACDEIVDLLSRLVDKSLVIVEDDARAQRRYRFLETIRQYGRGRLFKSGEIEALCTRHYEYFLELARRAEPELIRSDQVEWLNRLQSEHDNLRAALDWAVAAPECPDGGLELSAALWWFWTKRGYFTEGQRRLEMSLASVATPTALTAKAHIGLVHLMSFQRAPGTAAAIEKSLEVARAVGDSWAEAFSLGIKAILESDSGHFDTSVALADEALRLARKIPADRRGFQPRALAMRMLAYGALQSGDHERAGALFEETIAVLGEAGEKWSLGILLSDLAALRALQGRNSDALNLGREAIRHCQQLEDRRGLAWCLQTLAMVYAAEGKALRAARLCGAAEGLLESVGATGQITATRVQDRYIGAAIASIGDAAFRSATAEGRLMSLQQAIVEAGVRPIVSGA